MKNKIVKIPLRTVITLISGLLLGVVNDITAGPLPVSRQKKRRSLQGGICRGSFL